MTQITNVQIVPTKCGIDLLIDNQKVSYKFCGDTFSFKKLLLESQNCLEENRNFTYTIFQNNFNYTLNVGSVLDLYFNGTLMESFDVTKKAFIKALMDSYTNNVTSLALECSDSHESLITEEYYSIYNHLITIEIQKWIMLIEKINKLLFALSDCLDTTIF